MTTLSDYFLCWSIKYQSCGSLAQMVERRTFHSVGSRWFDSTMSQFFFCWKKKCEKALVSIYKVRCFIEQFCDVNCDSVNWTEFFSQIPRGWCKCTPPIFEWNSEKLANRFTLEWNKPLKFHVRITKRVLQHNHIF